MVTTNARLIRAAVTDAEWLAVRKHALTTGRSAAELVAEALRASGLTRPSGRRAGSPRK